MPHIVDVAHMDAHTQIARGTLGTNAGSPR